MSEALKKAFRGKCGEVGKHIGPFDPGDGVDDPGGACWGCSTAHVEEFGECEGLVESLVDYNNNDSPHDTEKVGPEVDVRWQPSGLRYAYHPDQLELVS